MEREEDVTGCAEGGCVGVLSVAVDKDDGVLLYEVDRVITHRVPAQHPRLGKRVRYQVKWVGYALTDNPEDWLLAKDVPYLVMNACEEYLANTSK